MQGEMGLQAMSHFRACPTLLYKHRLTPTGNFIHEEGRAPSWPDFRSTGIKEHRGRCRL